MTVFLDGSVFVSYARNDKGMTAALEALLEGLQDHRLTRNRFGWPYTNGPSLPFNVSKHPDAELQCAARLEAKATLREAGLRGTITLDLDDDDDG